MKNITTLVTKKGRIVSGELTKSIVFNMNVVTHAIIELDHINYGLNKKTGLFNKKARTQFTVNDIEKFLQELDNEELVAFKYKGLISKFVFRFDSPVNGRFYKKEFIIVFTTDYSKPNEIYTVTLYPGW